MSKRFLYFVILLMWVSCARQPQDGCAISYEEYFQMSQKYPEVILYNQSPKLSQYNGELGEEDPLLVAFLYKKEASIFKLLIQQERAESGNDNSYIKCYSETVPDTTKLFVYSSMYSSPFILYSMPDTTDVVAILGYIVDPIFVIDVRETWLYVHFIYENNEYKGWIPKTECCSNPYSTCG